jgi:hypothetical protein
MGVVYHLRRCGSYFALAALALQIALSFGHIHRHDLAGAAATAVASAEPSRQIAPQLPDADEYCAICASIFLVSTSFVPDAPQLPLPALLESPDRSIDVAFVVDVGLGRAPFQPRAPPLA